MGGREAAGPAGEEPEPGRGPAGDQRAGGAGATTARSGTARPAGLDHGARGVRDRQVVLLAGLVVALVLGLQALSLAVPAFADAVDEPPTVIALLVAVTVLVLARALLAARSAR